MDVKVHDLIKVKGIQALETKEPLPHWAVVSLKEAPYVVVRRAEAVNNKIPVGIRGKNRVERMAAWVDKENVERIITPEEIIHQRMWAGLEKSRRQLAQVEVLLVLDGILRGEDLPWGPGGSAGFELVSKMKAINANSDVDILIRVDEQSINKAEMVKRKIDKLPVHIDVQLETDIGAIALEDYLGKNSKVLVRTIEGPRLLDRERIFQYNYSR